MKTRKFRWISIIMVALALIGLVGFQLSTARTALADSSISPVGSWVVTVEAEGQPTIIDLASFHKDRTLSVVRNGGTGEGVWEKTSPNTYAFTFWALLDPDLAPPVNRVKVVSTIKLSKDGEQYTGSITAYLYDKDGNLLFPSEAKVTGVRMHVEPMP